MLGNLNPPCLVPSNLDALSSPVIVGSFAPEEITSLESSPLWVVVKKGSVVVDVEVEDVEVEEVDIELEVELVELLVDEVLVDLEVEVELVLVERLVDEVLVDRLVELVERDVEVEEVEILVDVLLVDIEVDVVVLFMDGITTIPTEYVPGVVGVPLGTILIERR